MNFLAIIPLADTWGMHNGDVGWGWMMVLMVLFWAAVIFGIVWLVRGGATGNWSLSTRQRRETAAEILERRFAEGAISVDEYRERREVIGNGTAKRNGDQHREPLRAPTAGEGE